MSSITLEGKDFEKYLTLKEKHRNEIAAKNEEIAKLNESLEGVISEKYEEVGYHIYSHTKIFFSNEVSQKLKESAREIKNLREQKKPLEKELADVCMKLKQLKNRTLIQRIFRKYE